MTMPSATLKEKSISLEGSRMECDAMICSFLTSSQSNGIASSRIHHMTTLNHPESSQSLDLEWRWESMENQLSFSEEETTSTTCLTTLGSSTSPQASGKFLNATSRQSEEVVTHLLSSKTE